MTMMHKQFSEACGDANALTVALSPEVELAPAEIHVPTFLRQTLTEPFDYYPNPGNAGDALMAKATYDLFEALELKFDSFDHSSLKDAKRLQAKTVVLGGGGNFAEGGYNNYADILARLHQEVEQVVVLPHTIHGNTQLLSQLGENVTLICRERVSYKHVKQHAPKAKVYLAHDMALLLDAETLLAFKPRYFSAMAVRAAYKLIGSEKAHLYPTFDSYLSGLRLSRANDRQSAPGTKIAHLFRTDIEKTQVALPADNLDASLAFNFGVTSPIKATFTVHHLMKYLNSFDVINTNRLHVAIAAGLLGKQVNLSSNSYFKCRAVYDYSLKVAFPNISWASPE